MWKKNPLAPKMNKHKFLRLESPSLGDDMRRTEGSGGLEAEDTSVLLAGHVACKAARPRERTATWYLLAVTAISSLTETPISPV